MKKKSLHVENADNLYNNARYDEAFNAYTYALSIDPQDYLSILKNRSVFSKFSFYSIRAQTLIRLERYDDAIDDCLIVLKVCNLIAD